MCFCVYGFACVCLCVYLPVIRHQFEAGLRTELSIGRTAYDAMLLCYMLKYNKSMQKPRVCIIVVVCVRVRVFDYLITMVRLCKKLSALHDLVAICGVKRRCAYVCMRVSARVYEYVCLTCLHVSLRVYVCPGMSKRPVHDIARRRPHKKTLCL